MIILVSMLVAILALIFGFLLGLAFGNKPKIHKKQTAKKIDNAQISKEYENFLNYDDSVQQ